MHTNDILIKRINHCSHNRLHYGFSSCRVCGSRQERCKITVDCKLCFCYCRLIVMHTNDILIKRINHCSHNRLHYGFSSCRVCGSRQERCKITVDCKLCFCYCRLIVIRTNDILIKRINHCSHNRLHYGFSSCRVCGSRQERCKITVDCKLCFCYCRLIVIRTNDILIERITHCRNSRLHNTFGSCRILPI